MGEKVVTTPFLIDKAGLFSMRQQALQDLNLGPFSYVPV